MSSASARRAGCRPDGTFRDRDHRDDPAAPAGADRRRRHREGDWFWFRGGGTLILDPREGHREVRYNIVKSPDSARRLERQRARSAGGFVSPLALALFRRSRAASPSRCMHDDHGDAPWLGDVGTRRRAASEGRRARPHPPLLPGHRRLPSAALPTAEGGDFWMLIDCGVHRSVTGGSDRMRKIVDDIAETAAVSTCSW